MEAITERRSREVEPESGVAWETKKEYRSGEAESESEVAWGTTEECLSGGLPPDGGMVLR